MSTDAEKLKQKQKIRKYLVFTGMFLLFLGCMWLIFAPSEKDRQEAERKTGFNAELPDPKGTGIEADKMAAYEQADMIRRQEDIFASSIMSFPSIIAQFAGKGNGTGIGSEILRGLSSNNWCNPSQIQYSWGLIVYVVLCVFFAYFYTSITFNPLEVADNIKKQGGFIPGIRPGKPTSDYLTKILNYIIFIGAVGLIIVCVIPFIFNGVFGANVSFGGTSIIIVVGVILETVKQIESQLLVRNYKGFLNN